MLFTTKRLLLRPWRESDASSLYALAKDPLVGPAAGWPVHTSVENSLEIIRGVLSAEGTFAVAQKIDDIAIGSIGLMVGQKSNLQLPDDQAEIGYWIGVPYWGRGMIPEAVREMIRYAFEQSEISVLWSGYFDGNDKSRRVQEKCGFLYHHTEQNKHWPLIDCFKTQHITRLTKAEWQNTAVKKEKEPTV